MKDNINTPGDKNPESFPVRPIGIITAIEAGTVDAKQMKTRNLVVRGGISVLLGHGSSQVIRLISNLVLTRLLVPDVFGLMALLNLLMAGLEMFSDLGIGPCIIQNRKGDDPRFLNTAFTVQIIRGAGLWLATCLIAYPFSRFYNQPQLIGLIPVAALVVIINGFASTSIWTLTRQVRLGKVVALRVISSLTGVTTTIIWALIEPSVWAIIAGNLVAAGVTSLFSHFLISEKNHLGWAKDALHSLWMFGSAIFLSSATWFMAGQAESLILGKYISIAQLGVFSIALLLAESVATALREVINRVIFPTVSNTLRVDRNRALQQYRKVRLIIVLITVPMALFLILGSDMIVSILLDKRYSEAGWMLQILTIRAVVGILNSPNSSLLMADAKLKYFPIANSVRFLWITIGTIAAFHLSGFVAAVWVLGLAALPQYAIMLWGIKRHFNEVFWREIQIAGIMLVIVGGCIWLTNSWI